MTSSVYVNAGAQVFAIGKNEERMVERGCRLPSEVQEEVRTSGGSDTDFHLDD